MNVPDPADPDPAPGTVVRGYPAGAGRATGPVRWTAGPVPEPDPDERIAPEDRAAACERIRAAAQTVSADLAERAETARGACAEVLRAGALMAVDPTLSESAVGLVTVRGLTPQRAVHDAAATAARDLRSLGGYFAERARDVLDVAARMVAVITGRPVPGVPLDGGPHVLLARDLAPADTATLDPRTVLALVTAEGGPTCHTAVLARSLGLPAVVAAPGIDRLAEGTVVLVDGSRGTVTVMDPAAGVCPDGAGPAGTAGHGPRGLPATAARRSPAPSPAGPGRTLDGTPVALLANVGDPEQAAAAARSGAEGIGLFRTEFCFLDRTAAPGIEEQAAAYRKVLDAFPGRRVVIRTLDAGADKPLPFVTAGDEPNPALGVRGLRTARSHPGLLADQLTAIALAARQAAADVRVMAPMVATAEEAARFAALCADHGLDEPGVMIEVPAAALCAEEILHPVAFASLGTNDLAQYTLAADRQLGRLAELTDPWQPAVLRLADLTCRAGARLGRPVGVCGEAAADPLLARVLVGLGVRSLSMTPTALGPVAAALAGSTLGACAAAARAVLRSGGPEQARRNAAGPV